MKKQLIRNATLALIVISICWATSLMGKPVGLIYYLSVVFYFTLYTAQATILSIAQGQPSKFVTLYNMTSILKMVFAATFLVLYFLLSKESQETKEQIYFSLFFITLYFLFLVLNTRQLFKRSHEE